MSWCDVAFKRGKKVYNCTFYEKGIDCFGADMVVEYNEPLEDK
jgi:hypothetical protein